MIRIRSVLVFACGAALFVGAVRLMKPANAAPPDPPQLQWTKSDPRWDALERCRLRFVALHVERASSEGRRLDEREKATLAQVHRDLEALVGTRDAERFERAWRAHRQ